MDENLYLLKVAKRARPQVAELLGLEESPEFVRVVTHHPLSNFGYLPETVGAVMLADLAGLVVGGENDIEAPRLLVPWENVCYLADGDLYSDYAREEMEHAEAEDEEGNGE